MEVIGNSHEKNAVREEECKRKNVLTPNEIESQNRQKGTRVSILSGFGPSGLFFGSGD